MNGKGAGRKTTMRKNDDLISRQAAIDAISCNITVTGRQNAELVAMTIGTFADRIKALPAVKPEVLAYGSGILVENTDPDVIRVVRCENCAWWQREWSDERDYHYCTMEDDRTYREFYCANAERRTDG